MSVKCLELLKIYGMLDGQNRVADLSRFNEKQLSRILQDYRRERIRTAEPRKKLSPQQLPVLVSSFSASTASEALLTAAMVYGRVYANDPLIRYGAKLSSNAVAHNEAFGLKNDASVNRNRLFSDLKQFEHLAPVIRSGHLAFYPIETLHEPEDDKIPLFYSEDAFRSSIPQPVHEFVHASAKVGALLKLSDGRGFAILDQPPEAPCRAISIRFEDEDLRKCRMYLLTETQLEKNGDNTFITRSSTDLNAPIDEETYQTWVYQSINRTIIDRLNSLSREMELATHLNAQYVTESQFESKLLSKAIDLDHNPRSPRTDALNFLRAMSPMLNVNSPSLVAKLRQDNERLFERWQHTLFDVAKELSFDSDFSDNSRRLLETEIRPQVDELNAAITDVAFKSAGAAITAAGAFTLGLFSQHAVPLAALIGIGAMSTAGGAVASASNYISKRRGPAFIWSQLLKH